MAGAGGSTQTTTTSTPSDRQFAPTTKDDETTAWSASDSEFTTPTTMTASSNASGAEATLFSQTQKDATSEAIGHTYSRFGSKFNTGHAVLGSTVTKAKFWVKKVGAPTFTVYARVYDSGGTLKGTLGTKAVSTISTSEAEVEFGDGTQDISLAAGDRVVLEATGGDGSNHLLVYYKNSDVDANMQWSIYNGAWSENAVDPYIVLITHNTFAVTAMKDDKSNPTTLRHKTSSEVAPWVKADMGSAQELLGVAVHFHADTNITSFKIETSADDSTYTRRKTVPYSLITAGAWNIILFPRPAKQARYLKITGLDAGAKTLSINEIAVMILTESVINRRHRIIAYTPTDSCLTLLGA